MPDDDLVRGRVAKIVNDRTVILNIGMSAGVKKGMVFKILDDKPMEISDPESGEILDSIQLTKAVVKAVEVSERITVAQTYRSTRVRVSGNPSFGGVSSMFTPPKYEERFETLRWDDSKGRAIDEMDSVVAEGDNVESVADDKTASTVVTIQH